MNPTKRVLLFYLAAKQLIEMKTAPNQLAVLFCVVVTAWHTTFMLLSSNHLFFF